MPSPPLASFSPPLLPPFFSFFSHLSAGPAAKGSCCLARIARLWRLNFFVLAECHSTSVAFLLSLSFDRSSYSSQQVSCTLPLTLSLFSPFAADNSSRSVFLCLSLLASLPLSLLPFISFFLCLSVCGLFFSFSCFPAPLRSFQRQNNSVEREAEREGCPPTSPGFDRDKRPRLPTCHRCFL